MNPVSKPEINREFVHIWAATYPAMYDQEHYDPYIADGRNGDTYALRKLTEWKNPGKTGPMRLSSNKEKAFQKLLAIIQKDSPVASGTLRSEFSVASPVYAIFWHHVLFETPIFDVHTNRAFNWFARGIHLRVGEAAIPRGGHWELYDKYCVWFASLLVGIQEDDPSLDSRSLDRALFRWGYANSKSILAPQVPPIPHLQNPPVILSRCSRIPSFA